MGVKFSLAVEIEINSECNMACPYCPNSKAERVEKGRMDRSLYVEIMRQLRDINYEGRISYHFYNEPTLSPDLNEFVRLTREYLPKSRIELYSNGTLLDQPKIEQLIEDGVDRFALTKHFRANTDALESAMQNLPEDKRGKIRYQSFKDLSLTNRGGSLNLNVKNIKPPLTLPCFIPKCALVITVKGNVVPCYEDYFQKHVMGNVKDTHIIDIWNSERFVQFRENLGEGKRANWEVCKDCNNAWVIS